MPLEAVVAYANQGAPIGEALEQAMNNVIDYSTAGWPYDYKKQLDYLINDLKENEDEVIEERVRKEKESRDH